MSNSTKTLQTHFAAIFTVANFSNAILWTYARSYVTVRLIIGSHSWSLMYISGIVMIAISLRLCLLSTSGYYSTDFEVHRNWLAITHSVPLSNWYKEATSIWTLDYPPFFAYFEKWLSLFASFVDPRMLEIHQLNYAPLDVILFQRLSVLIADILVLLPGSIAMAVVISRLQTVHKSDKSSSTASSFFSSLSLTVSNIGLLQVDHIHFQYNGYLLGLLFFSIASAMNGKPLLASVFFSILLYHKHIFMYMAIPMGVFLLQDYCFNQNGKEHHITSKRSSFSIFRFSLLAAVFVLVSAVSLGPFISTGQTSVLLSRLFPFGRGLVHSYWAPNVWALYLALDRLLTKALPQILPISTGTAVSFSLEGGKRATGFLPNIPPSVALASLIVVGYVPLVFVMIRRYQRSLGGSAVLRRRLDLPLYLALGNYVAFLLGWHVHEKAILYSTITLSLPVHLFGSPPMKEAFFFLNLWSNFSLLPLLPYGTDMPLKMASWALYSYLEFITLSSKDSADHKAFTPLIYEPPTVPKKGLSKFKTMQIMCMVCLIIYQSTWSGIHGFLFSNNRSFEFLPLLLTSCCAAPMIFFHLGTLAFHYFGHTDEKMKQRTS